LADRVLGEAARGLYAGGQDTLERVIQERWCGARGVVGFWPANSVGDDVVVYSDETRTAELGRFHTLLAQGVETAEFRRARLVGINHDVVAHAVCRPESHHAARPAPALLDDPFQRVLAAGIEAARRLAQHAVGE